MAARKKKSGGATFGKNKGATFSGGGATFGKPSVWDRISCKKKSGGATFGKNKGATFSGGGATFGSEEDIFATMEKGRSKSKKAKLGARTNEGGFHYRSGGLMRTKKGGFTARRSTRARNPRRKI